MIRAYFTAVDIISPFLPPKYRTSYTDFKSKRDFKKNKTIVQYYNFEKYDKNGNFIKKIKSL